MRYVILGPGAIGGVIGGKLAVAGHEVALVARGAHLAALERDGLELRDPDETVRLRLPVAGTPGGVGLRAGDCVVLATKTQQAEAALAALAADAGELADELHVVCATNGVEAERLALRRVGSVYGMRVILAGTHLEPGVVEVATGPVFGLLDVGRYPSGTDEVAVQIAADLHSAGFDAAARDDVMSAKYLKLLSNVGNALDAAVADRWESEGARLLLEAAVAEARACYAAAGIVLPDEGEESSRRRLRGGIRPVNGVTRQGSSSRQSLLRGTGEIEADFLNGEIALLGRLHGVPTPVNVRLQRLANELAAAGRPPGSVDAGELAAELGL